MSSNTPNYNLIKPDPSDFYNIADFNTNSDRIDTALGQKLTTSAFKTTLDSHKATTTQAQNGTTDNTYMTPQKTLSAITANGVARLGTITSGENLNDYVAAGVYQVRTDTPASIVNFPEGAFGYGNLTILSGNPSNSAVITQIYTPYIVGGMYIRSFASGAWRTWDRMASFQQTGLLSNLLTTDKSNLVSAINELKSQSLSSSNKASTAQAQAGTDDSMYMTPLKSRQAIQQFVNSFGINNVSGVNFNSGSVDDISLGGFYAVSSTATGQPTPNSFLSLVHISRSGTSSASQLAFNIANGDAYYRVKNQNTWSTWTKFNYDAVIGQLSSLQTTAKNNLVAAINELKNSSVDISAKATTAQAQEGTDDNAYMTALKTVQSISRNALQRQGNIAEGTNISTLITPGIYNANFSAAPPQFPAGASIRGTLLVFRANFSGNTAISQMYLGQSAGDMYFRLSYQNDASGWTTWSKVSTSVDIGDLSALQTSIKTNIVAAINSAYNDTLKLNAKATTAQAQTGTNDDTYMTPLKTKQSVDYSINAIKATEAQAKAGTSNTHLMTPVRVNNVTGTLTNLQTTDKSSLVAAINENFTRVVNGKGLIATAINDMGGSASGSDSFQELADDIREIVPKYASGTIAVSAPLTPYSYYDASGTESMASVIVSGLTFQPTRIVIIGTGGISRITEYDFELGALSESIRCSAYTGNRRDSGATYHFKNTGNAYVTETGFKLPLISGSDNATWYAYE